MRTVLVGIALVAGMGCATAPIDCRASCSMRSDTCFSRSGHVPKDDRPPEPGMSQEEWNKRASQETSEAMCTNEFQSCIGSCGPVVY